MDSINNIITGLEFAQIGWVVPDIHAAVKFMTISPGIPKVAHSTLRSV